MVSSNKNRQKKIVYVVQHSYEIDGADETKFIGVFSSKKSAQSAVDSLVVQPGFKDHPDEFYISRYVIGELHWEEGFVSVPFDSDGSECE